MSKAEKIINLISLILCIWIRISMWDILAHNMSDFKYASWNAIEIFYKVAIKEGVMKNETDRRWQADWKVARF